MAPHSEAESSLMVHNVNNMTRCEPKELDNCKKIKFPMCLLLIDFHSSLIGNNLSPPAIIDVRFVFAR